MVRQKEYRSDFIDYAATLFGADFDAELDREREAVHDEKYDRHRRNAAERRRQESEDGREIGPLPECADPDTVAACRLDLLKFILTFGNADKHDPEFPDPFSDAQLYAIRTVQETLLHGGTRPLCLPRGFGKTTICEWGILWAIAYGHQHFVLIIAAKSRLAEQIQSNIMRIVMQNEYFQDCFPALCYPILALENSPGRAPGQRLDGRPTDIKINSQITRFPTVPGAPSSGALITTSGLEGSIRGMKIGKERPTAVLADDPQTDRSANSRTQTDKRWNLLSGAIRGLSGPHTNLAMIATITVQKPDDLSEKILEAWGGQRFSMLRSFPQNMELWAEYHKLLEIGIKRHITTEDQIRAANDFYKKHWDAMNEGAEAEWPTRFTSTELSAIQHAMNHYFANRETFFAEYQNTPQLLSVDNANLKEEELLRKIVPLPRYTVPADCDRITCGIDIQQDCLYWTTVAWGDGFRGHIMDYGRFPSGQKTIQDLFPNVSEKDAFFLALLTLCPLLYEKEYPCENGGTKRITKCLIDANRGLFTPQVRRACFQMQIQEQSKFSGSTPPPDASESAKIQWLCGLVATGEYDTLPETVFEPVFGWGKGAVQNFFGSNLKPGEERGEGWQRPPLQPSNLVRQTRYDTNLWKSNVRTYFRSPVSGTSSLTLFEGDEVTHYDYIQQVLAEKSESLTGPKGTIDFWTLIPGRDNHLWDCTIMAAVANAVLGGTMASGTPIERSSQIIFTADWDDWD
ncbi:MAG: phage terminase large subunit family protein [Thermoguttaceae bacterium]|nr:phage terminase large subunit family protein [Thermoguttaceae bacterium]